MSEGEWAVLRWTLIVLSVAVVVIIAATVPLVVEVLL